MPGQFLPRGGHLMISRLLGYRDRSVLRLGQVESISQVASDAV